MEAILALALGSLTSPPCSKLCLAQCFWEPALSSQSENPHLGDTPISAAIHVSHSITMHWGRVHTSKDVRYAGAAGPGGRPESWLPRQRPRILRYR